MDYVFLEKVIFMKYSILMWRLVVFISTDSKSYFYRMTSKLKIRITICFGLPNQILWIFNKLHKCKR